MKVMIVEDEALVAEALAKLIELDARYSVVGTAHDFATAQYVAEYARPDIAFVDIILANNTTGYQVASQLNRQGVACVLTSGAPPKLEMPEFSIGCLSKPFNYDDLKAILNQVELTRRTRVAAGELTGTKADTDGATYDLRH